MEINQIEKLADSAPTWEDRAMIYAIGGLIVSIGGLVIYIVRQHIAKDKLYTNHLVEIKELHKEMTRIQVEHAAEIKRQNESCEASLEDHIRDRNDYLKALTEALTKCAIALDHALEFKGFTRQKQKS